MSTSSPQKLWPGRSIAFLGICLIALNLRTAVSSISPIAETIDRDFPLSNVALGFLGTLPPLAFALAGVVAPWLARRLGIERSLVAATLVMIAGPLIRSVAPNVVVLAIGGAVALIGMGTANVLLPAMVKKYFPDRVGLVTSTYATFIALSASIPAFLGPRIAAAEGWRISVAAWALIALVALVPWLLLARGAHAASLPAAGKDIRARLTGLRQSRTAWAVTVVFAVGTTGFYSMFAVLPVLLVEIAEVSEVRAGEILSMYGLAIIPLSLLIPGWAARMKSLTPLVLTGVALLTVGYVGLLVAPTTVPWFWVAMVGFGGLLFPLALVLIGLLTRTPEAAAALSGFVQAIAYLIAALGPFLVALLRDLTGSWDASLIFLMIGGFAAIPAGFALSSRRYVDDELDQAPDDQALNTRG